MASSSPSLTAYEAVLSAPSNAPWIIMVHGVSQDHRVFNRQVEAFKSTHRLILIDLPGHGQSSEIPGPYGLQEYASSIGSALDHAGIDIGHFWGTHLGAGAGLLLACQRPDLFHSLILESPVFPGRPLRSVSNLLGRVSAIAREEGVSAARDVWWQDGGWFDVMRARPVECRAAEQRRIIEDFQGQPWLDSGLISRPLPTIDDALTKLQVPALIMNGEHDLSDFAAMADALEAIMPNVDRIIIAEAGGFPLWEFPDHVNQAVRNFFEHR